MKTNAETRFSDGTICDYCSNIVLTKVGLHIKVQDKDFCSSDCLTDYNDLQKRSAKNDN